MCLYRAIFTLSGKTLKLGNQFTYLGSNISFTKVISKTPNEGLECYKQVIDHIEIYLSDKIKRNFFEAMGVSEQLYECTTWTLTKYSKKKLDGNYTRMLRTVLNKSWKHNLKNSFCMVTYLPSPKTLGAVLEN